MTAKEKAIQLINKFSPHVNPYIGSGMLSNTHDDNAILWQSKICALTVVDEIMNAIGWDDIDPKDKDTYWEDVKNEIEKL